MDKDMVDNPRPEKENTDPLNTEANYSDSMKETSEQLNPTRTDLISFKAESIHSTEDNAATITSVASERLDGKQNHPETATNLADKATVVVVKKHQSEATDTNSTRVRLQVKDKIKAALQMSANGKHTEEPAANNSAGKPRLQTSATSASTTSLRINQFPCGKGSHWSLVYFNPNSTTVAIRRPLLESPSGGTLVANSRVSHMSDNQSFHIGHTLSNNRTSPCYPLLANLPYTPQSACKHSLLHVLGLKPDAKSKAHKQYVSEQRKHLPPISFPVEVKSLVQNCTSIYTRHWPTWVSINMLREMLKIFTDFDYSTGLYYVDLLHYKSGKKMGAALLRFATHKDCLFVYDQMRVITALQPRITVELDLHQNFSKQIDNTKGPKKYRLKPNWLDPQLPEGNRWGNTFTLIPLPENYQPDPHPGKHLNNKQIEQVAASIPLASPATNIQDWLGLKHATFEQNKLEVAEKLKNKTMPAISDYLFLMAKLCTGIFIINFPSWFQSQHYKHVLSLLTDFDWNNGIYVIDILKYSNHTNMGAVLIKFADSATCFNVFKYFRVATLLQEHLPKNCRLKGQLDIYGNGEKLKKVAGQSADWTNPKLDPKCRVRIVVTTLDEKEPCPNMYTNFNKQPDDKDDIVILVSQNVPQIDLTDDDDNIKVTNKPKSKNNDKDSLIGVDEASNDSDKTTVLMKGENSGLDDDLSELIYQELMDIDIIKMIKEEDDGDQNTDNNTVEVRTETDTVKNGVRETVQHKTPRDSDGKRMRKNDARSKVANPRECTTETATKIQSDERRRKDSQSKVADPNICTRETSHEKHSDRRNRKYGQSEVADPKDPISETDHNHLSNKRKKSQSKSADLNSRTTETAHEKQSDERKRKDGQSKVADPNGCKAETSHKKQSADIRKRKDVHPKDSSSETGHEKQSNQRKRIDGQSKGADPNARITETSHEKQSVHERKRKDTQPKILTKETADEKQSDKRKRKDAQPKVAVSIGLTAEAAHEKQSDKNKRIDAQPKSAQSKVADPTETAHEKQSDDVIMLTAPSNRHSEIKNITISDEAFAKGNNDGDTDDATEDNCKIVYVRNLPPVKTYTILKELLMQHTKFDIEKKIFFIKLLRQDGCIKPLGQCLLKFNTHEDAVEVASGLNGILVGLQITEATLDIGHKVSKSNICDNGTPNPNTQVLKRKLNSDGTQRETFPSQPKRTKFDDCWDIVDTRRAYMKAEEPDTSNYGFSKDFFIKIGCNLPLSSFVIVKNLHERVNEAKLFEVFSLAGEVKQVALSFNNNDYTARIEYDHPVEAVQAVSMLNDQNLYDNKMDVSIDNTFKKRPLPVGLSGIGKGLGRCGELVKGIRSHMELREVHQILYEMGRMNKFESKDQPFRARYIKRSNPPSCIDTSPGPGSKPNTSHALEALGAVLISLDVIPVGTNCTTLNTMIEALQKSPKIKTTRPQNAPRTDKNALTTQNAIEKTINPNISNSLVNASRNANESSQDICPSLVDPSAPSTSASTNAPPAPNPTDKFFSDFCSFMQKFVDNANAPLPDAPVWKIAETPNFNNYSAESQVNIQYFQNVKQPLPNMPQVLNPPDIPPNNLPPGDPHLNPNVPLMKPNPNVDPNMQIWRPNNMIPGDPNVPVLGPNIPMNSNFNMIPKLNTGITSNSNHLPVWGTHIEPHHQAPVNPKIPSLPGASFGPHKPGVWTYGNPTLFPSTPNSGLPQLSTKNSQERTAQTAAANSDIGNILLSGNVTQTKKISRAVCFQSLPSSVTTLELTNKMKEVGEIKYAEILYTGRAIVLFKEYEDAERCLQLFHRSKVDGQIIDVHFV